MTILLDISGAPECGCNEALDLLAKAATEPDDRSIWSPHDNPWLAWHVEDVTRRFQALLERLQDALARALTGEPIGQLAKADVPWARWTQDELDATRARLEAKPTSSYTLDDWMLLVDWLVQRYLPEGTIQTEAEYLAVRAQLLGKIEANMQRQSPPISDRLKDSIAALVPTEFRHIPPRILSALELNVLHVAKARAATYITAVTDATRTRMRTIIVEHVQAQILGQSAGQYTAMRTRLFDSFGQLNRDFRRIAVTEAGEACNSGFIAAQPAGQKVRRQEAYKGACDFCRSINGKVFKVVDPAEPKKDGETEVWLGKTNVGRSPSPRMRVGGSMVARPSSELWWCAAGVQHPHCRGAWSVVTEKPPEVSDAFASWLDAKLKVAKIGS